ncbi:hypothetical protein HanOQP8_Chr16g0633171 [Helianthus annuus]|nr:hypothetical protein HanIR_Chr16g0835431 [Helianthus annuus]KAJ0461994.1 hypothetical protein HanHA89_Chr16g0678511 [Helianthus annuus]KAJ0646264.1 hypothetical protein HanOQP8_Chr16g0633171 [Helianthus annuus]
MNCSGKHLLVYTYTPHNRKSAMAASGGAKTLTSSSSSAESVSQFWSTLPLRSSSQFLQGQIVRSLFSFQKELSILQVFDILLLYN